MATLNEKLLQDVLALPIEARAQLVEKILESMIPKSTSKKDPMKVFGALKDLSDDDWNIYETGLEELKIGNQKESKKKVIKNRC
jgi:hypothetical protein